MAGARDIPTEERLIFALDVGDTAAARELVTRLGDSVRFYKLGLELFMAGGYWDLASWLREQGKKVFADLKFYDVPATVGRAVRGLGGRGVTFATVHYGADVLRAAVEEADDVGILAVTVLTSFDDSDMRDMGLDANVVDVVASRARRAAAIGCAGIVASGQEARRVRNELGAGLTLVVPGIRPAAGGDDQKRTMDVEDTFRAGADYIVVGRPIRDAADPAAAAAAMQERIRKVFAEPTRN
jgi:orotidine-5'-phosphate decarboxylase